MNFIKKEFSEYFERPAKVQVDLTNRCNFDCIYCYNKSSDFYTKKELNDKQLIYLIEKIIKELNPVVVSFSGGEPLLRKDVLIKLIEILYKNDIEVWLTTNISLMTYETAVSLKEAGLSKIFTNIDSDIGNVHDLLRGNKGSFSKSISIIKDLVNIFGGDNIFGTLVVTKTNYKSAVNAVKKAQVLGVNRFHFIDFIPISEETKSLMLSKKEWLEFKQNIEKADIKRPMILQKCHSFLFMSKEYKKISFPFCMAGRFTMVITASGDIVPCNHLKKNEFYCGNAIDENLLDVWQNSEVFNKFRYYDYSDKGCDKCTMFKKCTGGCKAMAYIMKGDAFAKDPYCEEFGFDKI